MPIIAAFKCSNNIVCDTCGLSGHHATKCYKRGLNFLPRDVQRHITAYNVKYGTSPVNDSSSNPHKSYCALEHPDHRTSVTTSTQANSSSSVPSQEQIPTISSFNHVLPAC